MSKVEKLHAARERIIASLKHHIQIIGEFSTSTNQRLLVFRDRALDNTWEEFTENFHALEQVAADRATANALYAQNHSLEDEYFETKVVLSEYMKQPEESQDEKQARNSTFYEPKDVSMSLKSNFKLPPIQIESFSGEFEDWECFKDLFLSLLAQHNNLTSAQKLYYLRNALKGTALSAIKHVSSQGDNFDSAWDVLSKRYDNARAIVDAHLKRLFTIPVIMKRVASTIRNMIDITNECIAALKINHINTDTWDSILVYILTKKMDADTHLHWEEELNASRNVPKIEKLLDFLEVRYNVWSRLGSTTDETPKLKSTKTFFNQEKV